MSTPDAILLELREVNGRLARLEARIDAAQPTPWPDRMSTQEAVLYIRHAYRRPQFNRMTLYRWLDEGKLDTDIRRPRRWLRTEIDALLAGTPGGGKGRP